MTYNRNNHLKKAIFIVGVYNRIKQPDITDAHIVRFEFPRQGIYISYRQWMYIKKCFKETYPDASFGGLKKE